MGGREVGAGVGIFKSLTSGARPETSTKQTEDDSGVGSVHKTAHPFCTRWRLVIEYWVAFLKGKYVSSKRELIYP